MSDYIVTIRVALAAENEEDAAGKGWEIAEAIQKGSVPVDNATCAHVE